MYGVQDIRCVTTKVVATQLKLRTSMLDGSVLRELADNIVDLI